MKVILHAIDWTSIKLGGFSSIFLIIHVSSMLSVLSSIAVVSTIIYNGIRIYKEIRNKQ